jgi:hypothetical protein
MASTQVNTYFAKGNREGLTNQVADLFADEVPFFSMAAKETASNTKHEWQEDTLSAASTTAIVEGASLTYAQAATRTRHQNYCHIRLRNWEITNSQLAMKVAGVKDQEYPCGCTDEILLWQCESEKINRPDRSGRICSHSRYPANHPDQRCKPPGMRNLLALFIICAVQPLTDDKQSYD